MSPPVAADLPENSEPGPLAETEIWHIQAALHEMARQLDDPGIVAVGLGVKEAGGRRQRGAPLAARFYVRHKRRPRLASRRIPSELRLTAQRSDGTYACWRLPTDVEPTGGELELTGTPLTASATAVSGLTVSWLPAEQSDQPQHWQWGLLTVGHLCAGDPLPCGVTVRRRDAGLHSPRTLRGQMDLHSRPGDSYDAAILPFSFLELSLSGFIPDPLAMMALRHDEQLLEDARGKARGKALQVPPGRSQLRVKSFHATYGAGTLGSLQRVVMVEGRPGDFAPGTSGTVWLIDGMPAAMQVGAFAPEYRLGVGQSLLGCLLDWARPRLPAELIVAVHAF